MPHQPFADYYLDGYVDDGYVEPAAEIPIGAVPLSFTLGGTTVNFAWYTENGEQSTAKLQPLPRSGGGYPFGFASRVTAETIACTFSNLSKAEADALQAFFDVTADGMQKTFTYTDNVLGFTCLVRFATAELTVTPVAYNVYSTAFLLLRA